MTTVRVPETVRATVRAAGADAWLAGLPALIERLERDWDIAVGPGYEDATELLTADPWERARLLAARTGTDPAAIMDWGDLDRLANGLLCLETGQPEYGRISLAAADRIANLGV